MYLGSIIIVSYHSADCIQSCLGALAGSSRWKIIVVDNASADESVVKARAATSDVLILANSENKGFAGAINQAANFAEGEALVILNPDVVATPGALNELVNALNVEKVAAVGAMLTDQEGKPEKGFTIRRFPTLGSAMSEVLLLNRIWPSNPWNRSYRCLNLDYSRGQEVEQPAGACLAVKRKAFDELNGFDASFYPVWFEDVDFCRRLRDRNWKILYSPKAVFTHAGGHSVGKLQFRDRQGYWYGNLLRYFAKHHPPGEVVCLRVGIFAGLVLRSMLSLCGAGPNGVSIREALQGYCHALWEYAVVGKSLRPRSEAGALPAPIT
jgi:N-acetylglucosaminyl-diphospho-decaprenol L-rhamnosyltransferase